MSAAVDAPGVAEEGDRAAAVGGGVSNCLGWIGTLPDGWRVKPLRAIADSIISNVDKFVSDDEIPVRLCNYTDVYNNDFIKPDLDLMRVTASVQEIERFGLLVDDVIITKDSESWEDIGVPALVTETADDIVCGYHLALLRPHKDIIHGAFLFRCLQARPVQAQLELTANGVTRFGLSKFDIRRTVVPVPPLREQRAIADHLDRETARLDALVAAKERLLALLAEKRRAVVTRAVTRGLDPRVPTRASEACAANGQRAKVADDDVNAARPAWPIKRLRFLVQRNPSDEKKRILSGAEQATFLPMDSIGEQGDLDYSATRYVDEVRNGYTQFFDGDVLVAKITPCFENGKGALVDGTLNGVGFGTTELHVLTPTNEIDARYLYYTTISNRFRKLGEAAMFGAAGQKRVPEEFVRNYRVPVPQLTEQRAIVEYLDSETARLDALMGKVREAITLAKERRAALIAAAVTGRIKTRTEERAVEQK